MNRHAAVVIILITLLIAGCSALPAQDEPKTSSKPEVKLTNWYKVEITLSEFEDGKKTNTRAYTMAAEENGPPAVMKLGDRVPVATGPGTKRGDGETDVVNTQFQYIDVGLNISTYVRERQGRLGVTVSVDQSSVSKPADTFRVAPYQPMIRQLRMENTTFITPGKPIVIASVDDPGRANHKYTVEATVTKLNP